MLCKPALLTAHYHVCFKSNAFPGMPVGLVALF